VSREPLLCRLDGQVIAEVLDADDGQCALRYVPEVVNHQAGMRLLSVRLPVRAEIYPSQGGAQVFLDGVLPEGWVRDQLADNARLPREDTFGLLARYGGDCAGAVSFADPNVDPPAAGVRWLDETELIVALRDLRSLPLGDGTDNTIRLSLGGVQEKLVVVMADDRVGIPMGDQPSTHILKPTPLNNDGTERYLGLADVEHLCLTLARDMAEKARNRVRGIGFEAPATSLLQVAGRSVLAITRYDRRRDSGGTIRRLHQEDGCQVLGLSPDRKYQRSDDALPNLRAFADVLASHGADPVLDQRALLQQLTFTMCTGNADLHAKNLSILHADGVRLAPLYDVVVSAAYPGVDRELGLRVGRQYHLDDVSAGDLVNEAASWGLGREAAANAVAIVIEGVLDRILPVADKIRDAGFSGRVLDTAVAEITRRTKRLQDHFGPSP
jgi:serine/threonine-protein kinase HipA